MVNDLIRVGDRVEFRIDPKDDYYKQPGDPAGNAQGVCVARERITMYEDRVGLCIRKPGVYELNGPVIVQWDDGTTSTPNGWLLHMIDKDEEQSRRAQKRAETNDSNWADVDAKYEERVWIRELPVTNAWEGDFVRVKRERFGMKESYGFIERIDYYMMEQSGGQAKYSYSITDEFKEVQGGSTYATEDEVEIIERGNVYKYFNNEPIQFADLREEAAFFKSLGHCKEVRNPATSTYRWTLEEVIKAIADDIVDCFNMESVPFSFGTQSIRAQRFTDRELGGRLRATSLEGFNDLVVELSNRK
jgi:hypothetical protein